ncbi:hypothetical protein CS022_18625 [Veronia nyctiphanis]|uniref:Porin domain-containing protein n=1 Tax=Veronia nyctiphanis TaxID=1278244 RepID=A0A4Q0YME1_9GAMM|nr:porin [Veronia nyctiphanis]RXJ72012.1 hypothetical protein CS022_18625 [Veronia nyctiphanis]
MNKKFLAVAIPAALFAGSVSAYDVVTSDSTTVALSGEVGVKHTTTTGATESSVNEVTGGAAVLNVNVKHSVNDSIDALGAIKFEMTSTGDDEVKATGRYFGLSFVGGEHVVKFGSVDHAGTVGLSHLKDGDDEVFPVDGSKVLRYTFTNDSLTFDASHSERAAGVDDANATAVKAVTSFENIEFTVGHSQRAKFVQTGEETDTVSGVIAEVDFAPVTLTATYSVGATEGSKEQDDTLVKGAVDYQVNDDLELSASYAVQDTEFKNAADTDKKTAKVGAEYVMDAWTFNADLTDVADVSTEALLKAEYKFTDQFKANASAKTTSFEEANKESAGEFIVGATLTW